MFDAYDICTMPFGMANFEAMSIVKERNKKYIFIFFWVAILTNYIIFSSLFISICCHNLQQIQWENIKQIIKSFLSMIEGHYDSTLTILA
jgi:hypothetical protein